MSTPRTIWCYTFTYLGLLVPGATESEPTCPAGGCQASGEYYWPQQKGNMNRTGWSPYAVTTDLANGPTWRWIDYQLDVIRDTPLIDDKFNIYLGTQGARVIKFSPNGKVLWEHASTRGNIPAVPSIMDGRLYYNTKSGYVVALDMETGAERWATQIGSIGTAGDTACTFALNGTIVSDTKDPKTGPNGNNGNNGMTVALDTSGNELWRFAHEFASFNFQASSPGDGTIVFQDHSGGVYRLRLSDGGLIWESGIRGRHPFWFSTGATIVGPNGILYAASNRGSGEGIIHAYALEDGAPLWVHWLTTEANQAVAFGPYSPGRHMVVAGIGENPGTPLVFNVAGTWWWDFLPVKAKDWFTRLNLYCAGRPTWLWGTHVLKAELIALDAETGKRIWTFTPPPFTRPSCEGDEAHLNHRLARQAAAKDSDTVEMICLPDSWAQAVIGGDGTVYAGHQDGKLYAVKDSNHNGIIEDGEVSSYYFEAAFQASQAVAPGMLAVVPCGGGLWVWKN